MSEGLKIRAEIDAQGLKALQWVSGAGSVALAQFYLSALQHGPSLKRPIAIAFACNMLALVLSLYLHGWRRATSLRFEASKATRWVSSKRDWVAWYSAVTLVGAGLVALAWGFWVYSA